MLLGFAWYCREGGGSSPLILLLDEANEVRLDSRRVEHLYTPKASARHANEAARRAESEAHHTC